MAENSGGVWRTNSLETSSRPRCAMWSPTSKYRETICGTSFQDRKHFCDGKLQPHVAGGPLGLFFFEFENLKGTPWQLKELGRMQRVRLRQTKWLLNSRHLVRELHMTRRNVLGTDSQLLAAGQAAPSTEVCNESMQVEVESRTRASDTATEDDDPLMEGSEGAVDDDVTIADGHVSAEHGTILWESALTAKDMWPRWMLRYQCPT